MYSEINHVTLGKECQRNRKKAGWTQTDIAREIGCDIRSISLFETGKSTSFRVLLWYMLNSMIDNNMVRGCIKNGKVTGTHIGRKIY